MHIKPKKRLGQNFLVDGNVLRRIAAACELDGSDRVLEIGAGRGELTPLLAEKAAAIAAVEIDCDLLPQLGLSVSGRENVRILNADILKLNIPSLYGSLDAAAGERGKGLKAIGNIPYYIASPILEKLLLGAGGMIAGVYLTVQLEYGQRLCASAGSEEYGPLSLFAQYYSIPEMLFRIRNSCFYPVPKVDSCFVRLIPRAVLPLRGEEEKKFFRLVAAAFGQRRKMLKNTLKGLIEGEALAAFLEERDIPFCARGEVLSPDDFVELVKFSRQP
ncbi:MAG: 16S rRNA (adenine(1518)-N(6)/adenine(1519)-N(6))-dimethyltransferase RsmA [Candidatus Omnitrophota bacterium]|jgi:16S rRNA (adenine1518-N6/adenine1519-N6)-dimethyltransferase